MTSAIITITQGDFEYLHEWITYHYNIGFNIFFIGYNGNYNDFNKLPKYDYVKYFDFSTDTIIEKNMKFNYQKNGWPIFFKEAISNIIFPYIQTFYKDIIKYVAIIDTDEFVSSSEKINDITSYLDSIYDQSLKSEFIYMQFYNGNNQIYYENKPVLERFTTYVNSSPLDEKINGYKKSILNLQNIDITDVLEQQFHENNFSNTDNNLPFDKIVIKHFFCKSLEEWTKKMDINYDKNYYFRFYGEMFSGWGSYFCGFLNNKITKEAIKAIPILLKKYNINYKPELEEKNEEFKKIYKKYNKKLNIFILSTGVYNNYLNFLYQSLNRLFPNIDKIIYLISDENIEYNLDKNIIYNYYQICDLPYPFITYNKVNYICNCINKFNIDINDYFIYLDADSIILEKDNIYWDNLEQIIINNKICFTKSPWGPLIDEHNNDNKQSCTFIKNKENMYKYIQASMIIGYISNIIELNSKMNNYMQIDCKNRVLPHLNDQSLINKLIIDDNYPCYIDYFTTNFYENIKDINDLNKLNDDTIICVKYIEHKDTIFCIQKINPDIKNNKRNYKYEY